MFILFPLFRAYSRPIGAQTREGNNSPIPIPRYRLRVYKLGLRLIIGITQFTTKAHIIRATLEAVAFQNLEIVESMNKDSGINLKMLQVSGGMSKNRLLLQMQADFLGIPVG